MDTFSVKFNKEFAMEFLGQVFLKEMTRKSVHINKSLHRSLRSMGTRDILKLPSPLMDEIRASWGNHDIEDMLTKSEDVMRSMARKNIVAGNSCIACMQYKANTVLVHGDTCHRCMCTSCALELFLMYNISCPMCRCGVDMVVVVKEDDRVCGCSSSCKKFLWTNSSSDAYIVSPSCKIDDTFKTKVCEVFE